jgi:hypothetical protein
MLEIPKPGTATSSLSEISLSNLGPEWEQVPKLPTCNWLMGERATWMRGGVGITVLMIDGESAWNA